MRQEIWKNTASILLFKAILLFGILIFFCSKMSLDSYVSVETKLKDNTVKMQL